MATVTEKAGRAHDVGVETLRSLGLHRLSRCLGMLSPHPELVGL